MFRLSTILCAFATLCTFTCVVDAAGAFNQPGNVLVSDTGNSRVVEFDQVGNLIWQFGTGSATSCVVSAQSCLGPYTAQRLANATTLIACTGNGASCADNRVIIVNNIGSIVWSYGVLGNSPLSIPVSAFQLANTNILIADSGNHRVIIVDLFGNLVWNYATASTP